MKRNSHSQSKYGSITNGWDAVLALNAEQLTTLFFQQFLGAGTGTSTYALQTILNTEGSAYAFLDFSLGSPDISFPEDDGTVTCALSIYLTGGSLVFFDWGGDIQSAILLQPDQSELIGPLDLPDVTGTVSDSGQVTATVAANGWQVNVEGVGAGSEVSAQIEESVGTFFKDNPASYILGTLVGKGTTVPACLMPTAFRVAAMANPGSDADDGCVLILIQTNGPGGFGPSVDAYPVPDGHTAGLVVSNQVLFNQLLPPALTDDFKDIGSTFKGVETDGVYRCEGSSGRLNLGTIQNSDQTIYSSDKTSDVADVKPWASGLTVATDGKMMKVDWQHKFYQYWTQVTFPYGMPVNNTQKIHNTASYKMSASPVVKDNGVCFPGSGSAKFTAPENTWWQQLLGHFDIPSACIHAIKKQLGHVFKNFALPHVNTFALENILFPGLSVISLQTAEIPCGLQAGGTIQAAVTVSPATITLGPGAAQAYALLDANGQPIANVLWQLQPIGLGSMKDNTYTAPPSLTEAQMVVLTGVNVENQAQQSRALIVLSPEAIPQALTVSPSAAMVTAGNQITLQVSEADAMLTASPDMGTLAQGPGTGEWFYTAPDTIGTPQTVTITATSGKNSGTATVYLVQSQPVTVQASASTSAPGQTVTLSASAPVTDLTNFRWGVYPQGAGTLTPDANNSTQASFQVAATLPAGVNKVMVFAYALDQATYQSAGIGSATLSLQGSS